MLVKRSASEPLRNEADHVARRAHGRADAGDHNPPDEPLEPDLDALQAPERVLKASLQAAEFGTALAARNVSTTLRQWL